MTMSMYSTTDKMKMSAPSCFPGRYSPSYRSSEQMRRCMPNPSIHISSSCDSLESRLLEDASLLCNSWSARQNGDIFAGINDGILSRAEALAAVDIQKHQAQHVHSQMPSQIKHDVMYHHHSMSGPPQRPLQMHHSMDQLDMLDPTGSMTTLAPISESPLTPTHQHLHGSYHSMNHMMSHHHPGTLSGHTGGHHGHSAVHHPVITAAVAAAGLHPDTDTDPRELEAFAERFKQRRIKLGVTQADVGKALANLKLPGVGALSQSTICRFESLTLSHNNMIALKPILQAWLEEAEAQAKNKRRDPDAPSVLPAGEKKRKRTSIAAPEKRSLEAYFAVQPRPSGEKIAAIAEKLDLKKNVVRVWFCNQRQKQKRIVSSVTPSMTGHGSAGFGY
ncbi:inhibitory POU protein isoform X3 [Drosophila suzukii]|uniref:POU domain protein n=1 Tax=Drosophila suzukii TaxID=28584 RepID=A0AB39YY44_DROSZ|nr:inhibitory POU protein isoform X3 [Drosophila suzukii]XP_026837917.1 inhibitory POU protein isoform X3 [Drosophila erecta]XP_032582216.1 inhibitory POU protein isoform X3 [Drosophila sechellia]XP_039152955.1 inhibitory POU protein isoform X3 [Drosophila simulans]XP_039229470.1 inhibitory POU protein isoform X3 [Drosophila yakuba]XP_043949151.1 inhibitory POU protein isoform X1 [Drosophila biarmipes]